MTEVIRSNEEMRLRLQVEIDSQRSQKERNELGQFATPPAMAREIVAASLDYLKEEQITFLDPGVGSGSFFSAVISLIGKKKIKRAFGIEIDSRFATTARNLWKDFGLEVVNADFTKLTPTTSQYVNFLISNPPYVRHHHLDTQEKLRLKSKVKENLGIDIPGLAGLYCYFMLLADQWMAPGGIATWLIPSEFLDVNYGSAVKDYLLNHVELIRVHKFDPSTSQFDDALVSSAVVWFKKSKPSQKPVAFTFGNDLKKPIQSIQIQRTTLTPKAKWSRYSSLSEKREITYDNPFSDFFSIKRGIATGNNQYFILSEEQVREMNLPRKYVRPILPNPRNVPTNAVEADSHGDPSNIKRQYLISCDDSIETIEKNSPELAAYFKRGEQEGVSATYLCSRRKPWYSQEKRESPLILCTYMGRTDRADRMPFRFILNQSKAVATNVYLLLYPTARLKALIQKDPDLPKRVVSLLNQINPERLIGSGRVYGGGLHKLEPKELANMMLSPKDLGLTESWVASSKLIV